jgi:DHA1 family multidrug resistance protein-like MFS transporter
MDSWRCNLFIITDAETTALVGFYIIIPFLPYYVQELGVTDSDQIEFWSSWLFSGQAIALAVMAPIWGSLFICLDCQSILNFRDEYAKSIQ